MERAPSYLKCSKCHIQYFFFLGPHFCPTWTSRKTALSEMGGTFRSSTILTELQADKEKQITQSAIVTIHYLIIPLCFPMKTQSPSKITSF